MTLTRMRGKYNNKLCKCQELVVRINVSAFIRTCYDQNINHIHVCCITSIRTTFL